MRHALWIDDLPDFDSLATELSYKSGQRWCRPCPELGLRWAARVSIPAPWD